LITSAFSAHRFYASTSAGIQCFMAVHGLCILFETPISKRKARAPYIAVSLLIFVAYTVAAGLDATRPFEFLLQASNGIEVLDTWGIKWQIYTYRACYTLLTILGDGMLLYRCYLLLQGSLWLMAFPMFTYLAVIALSIAQIAVLGSRAHYPVEGACVGMSIVTNVTITALISTHIIKGRKGLSPSIIPSSSLRIYTGTAHILIESALPLTLSGIGFAAVLFAQSGKTIPERTRLLPAEITFTVLYYAFLAISPQMIVFRVTTGRSW
ncbi:hypothetical protein FA15DRAFT_576188, partial [Coprinopsis marcescibilis]